MNSKQSSEINQRPDSDLAEPFSQIFVDRAEADWAFDLLREATRQLRVTDPYDPRVAVTVSTRSGKPFLHLNFGNWLVLGFRAPGSTPTRVDMALLADRVSWDERFTSFASDRKEGEPEVRSYEVPIETIRPLTSHLHQAFEATLDFIADKFASWKRSPHWKQHNPEIIEALFDPEKREQLFTAGLAEPELRYERHLTTFHLEAAEEEGVYGEDVIVSGEDVLDKGENGMNLEREKVNEMVLILQGEYPKWSGFSDPDFMKDEINYKQATITKARDLLSRSELERLITEREFDEFIDRLDKIGKDSNLLWRSVPTSGDLNILYHDELDKSSFCDAVFDLLYGPDESPHRLERYLDYVEDKQLPNKWTFPTYFLFVCFPETEMFIKPRTTKWFVEFLGEQGVYTQKPSASTYISIRNLTHQLKDVLQEYEPRDMVDIQGFIWVCYGAKQGKDEKDENGEEMLAIPVSEMEGPEIMGSLATEAEVKPDYPLSRLAEDTGFDEDTLNRWVRAIERKGQAILYGPPGTGKTFIAEGLAKHLIGGGVGFAELVQFHPAYAYEDFMQGLRPKSRSEGGLDYRMVPGRFLEFCQRAQRHDGRCVLIIDEINRADLARVFGELMYLLEYRNREVPLAGGGSLKIPDNVRLIGTMNTADRSIALVDHALRRRFAFIALRPNYEVLRQFHRRLETAFPIERLIKLLTRLNGQIEADYQVGITFFLRQNLADEIEDIWRMEIEPYLEEYFFDQRSTVDDYRWDEIRQEILPE